MLFETVNPNSRQITQVIWPPSQDLTPLNTPLLLSCQDKQHIWHSRPYILTIFLIFDNYIKQIRFRDSHLVMVYE